MEREERLKAAANPQRLERITNELLLLRNTNAVARVPLFHASVAV